MTNPSGNIDPNLLVAMAAMLIMVICVLTGLIIYLVVLRPKLKIRRRMSDLGLLPNVSHNSARSTANARQLRIQGKLQELEEKGNKKKRRTEIRAKLLQAGLDISVRKYFFLTAALGLILGTLAILSQSSIYVGICVALVGIFGLPNVILTRIAKSRQKKFTEHFTDALDVMVRGVKSGLPVGECLTIIGREAIDPVGETFRHLVEGQKLGIDLDELLERGIARMPTPEFKFFAIVLLIQQQTGGNLAETIDGLSTVLRDRKKMKDKITSLSTEARASAAIIGSLPFFVTAIMYLMNPDYIGLLFTETTGNIMLFSGLATMSVGVFVMSKMTSFNI
jgi:tight adherence protein B